MSFCAFPYREYWLQYQRRLPLRIPAEVVKYALGATETQPQIKHHFFLGQQIVSPRHLGQAGEARGHHGAIMPAVDTLLELCAECRALRTRAD